MGSIRPRTDTIEIVLKYASLFTDQWTKRAHFFVYHGRNAFAALCWIELVYNGHELHVPPSVLTKKRYEGNIP